MNKLFGIHWYSEGDVFLVINAEDVRQATEMFLAEEYKLISEVEPKSTITSTVHYHSDGTGNVEIKISNSPIRGVPVKDVIVLGIVTEVKEQKKPVLLQDLVQISIRSVAVTSLNEYRSASKTIPVAMLDKPSKAEQKDVPLNL